MSLEVVLGYTATALNIWGNVMLTRMSRTGWLLRLAVNVLYILWSLQVDNSGPILANHLVFVAINIKGFVAWKQLTDQAAPSKV